MKTDTPRPIYLRDYRPPNFLIKSVNLDFKLDAAATKVRSRLKVRHNPKSQVHNAPLILDGENLKLDAVILDGNTLTRSQYRLTKTSLTIPETPIKPFTLEIHTTIDPSQNKSLQGLYRSRGVFCTQCEAQGFRRITYFLDRPDVLSTYTVRLEADPKEAPVLLSNGNRLERGTSDRGERHYAVWHDPHPKPCYLFALVAGDLSSIAADFKTASGSDVGLTIYVEHGKEERAAWAMDSLKRSMRWDEKRFGREYDLEVFNIVAVSDFNMGAMENKGLNIFNDRLVLASPETATDTTFEAIESVVAHEYFHNWTGNRITCRDWFQLCLKEGLTVYRDQEFSADERSRVVQRISDVRQLKAHQFPEDSGPLAHPVRPESYIEINNFYTATVYEKGAEIVRMIATILGAEAFRSGMDLYFERHDGEAATIEQFLECFAEVSGRDLSQFALWYSQSGTPHVECRTSYDKRARTYSLTLKQTTPQTPGQQQKNPMHIPLRIGLLGPDGHDLPLTTDAGDALQDDIIHLRQPSQTITFTDVPARPIPSVLREFSAPVHLEVELSEKDLAFLLANDSDAFNRWQAANTYAMRTMVAMVEALSRGKRSSRGTGFAKALSAALVDDNLDWAFRAELMRLPSQSDVATEIGQNVDHTFIYRAHRQLTRLIARRLEDQLAAIHDTLKESGPFSPDAANAGKRAARNAALQLLASLGSKTAINRTADQYFNASNMTEAAHALNLLAASNSPQRRTALDHFYQRWHEDHVVIDTWFVAQAQSPRNNALDVVRALTRHERFDITAPNKVRALIGNFALMNPVQFNRPDGKGYEFLVEQILAIDRFNPQIAARLLNAMRSWRALEPKRRKLARNALTKITKHPDPSRDVHEIVLRILDE
ncbi:aminopeptidase N [Filomicrobium insigne]|nr:aminopeptidase N [Filomicrobium insigne]